jgi:cytochrome c5
MGKRIVGIIVALAACRAAPPPAQQAASTALSRHDALLLAAASIALPPPGVTAADLPEPASTGAQLAGKYCAQCHELPAPSMHSATDWPGVVRRMWLRMELLPPELGVQVPTAAERSAMLEYMTQNALQVSGASLPAGPGRAAFAEVCSRCHALPDPRVHSRQDWATVFQRMERNMERMKLKPLTRPQTTDILLYLQETAARR